MASIHREFHVDVDPGEAWAALRDVGAVHTRLAAGFVVDTRLEDGARLVTFANGAVVKELIVSVDDARRRVAYAVVEWQTTHHHASFQVFADGGGSRIVWTTDLLPDALAEAMAGMIDQGVDAIRRTLARGQAESRP